MMSVYVTCMGGVYRFTGNRLRHYLLMVAADTKPVLDDHAVFLGPIAGNFTSITPEEAREMFMRMYGKKDDSDAG